MNKNLDDIDRQAEREGKAIQRHRQIALKTKSNQVKKFYVIDGHRFETGFKKRSIIQHAGT